GVAGIAAVAAGVDAVERLGNDLERETRHVSADVARLAWAPAGQHPLGEVHHVGAVALQPPGVEGRHRQLPLVQPGVAVRDLDAAPDQRVEKRTQVVLAEVVAAHAQDLADQLGVVEEEDLGPPDPELGVGTTLPGKAPEESQAVAPELVEAAGKEARGSDRGHASSLTSCGTRGGTACLKAAGQVD